MNAEEAWFWGLNAIRARAEGENQSHGHTGPNRPCEPDDIAASVERLRRERKLDRDHVRTLVLFGLQYLPPRASEPREASDARRWDEAMDRLTTIWRRKGIIE